MKRLRVTRTLVFEGPEDWITRTLEESWLAPEGVSRSDDLRTSLAPDRSAVETSRVIEEVSS